MIYGIGQDIVENIRIEELLSKYGDRFMKKVLSPYEITKAATKYYPARYIAKRFAAKEAFSKACGMGFRSPVLMPYITVANAPSGKPFLEFAPKLQAWLDERGIKHSHVSLTDEKATSMALVILEAD